MPERRSTLLFYCQHSLGIGHLTRSFALARPLAAQFRVVFLNGGPIPAGVPVPDEIELVNLPPLGMDDGHTVVSRAAGTSVDDARAERRRLLLDAVATQRPAVLLIELFPFGRKKFAGEILAMIRAARHASGTTLRVVCSVRDILVHARPDQARHDDRARWLVDRYFDAVLVHADPNLARLEQTFAPTRPMRTPVHHTGLVVPQRRAEVPVARRSHVLVSAGGGIVGGPLFRLAIEAQRLMWPRLARPMRIVAGPFLPPAEWDALQQLAQGVPALELVRQVSDLAREMREAAAAVNQCGYNTALDVVVSGVPALVLPYAAPGETEQTERANRLAALGAVRYASMTGLDAAALASQIEALIGFTPRPAGIALDGAQRSTALIAGLHAEARAAARASNAAPAVPRAAAEAARP